MNPIVPNNTSLVLIEVYLPDVLIVHQIVAWELEPDSGKHYPKPITEVMGDSRDTFLWDPKFGQLSQPFSTASNLGLSFEEAQKLAFKWAEDKAALRARYEMKKAPDAPTSEASVHQPPAKETERDQ